MERNFSIVRNTSKKIINDTEIKQVVFNIENPIKYQIVGIQTGKEPRIYKTGTIEEICRDECLNEYGFDKHETINDVLRDMDCFSNYVHYAKIVI
jgi:hypothetical protein